MVFFGQIVVGPPGCGKTTYCHGMLQFLTALDRCAVVINMDFANDAVPYAVAIDVRELITLETAMEDERLGPNGGLIFCMEKLVSNIAWLTDKIESLPPEVNYILFDFPGQVELYSHHKCVYRLLAEMKSLDLRLCAVHLVDSFYCSQPSTFISAALLAASTMMRLGLPHVNVLSKVDLLSHYGQLPFNLDFYTELEDLRPLAQFVGSTVPEQVIDVTKESEVVEREQRCERLKRMESKLTKKFKKMTTELCEVLSDFGLISFLPIDIQDGSSVGRVLTTIDKANGFSFAAAEARAFTEQRIEQQKEAKLCWRGTSTERRTSVTDQNSGDGRAAELFKLASQECEPTYFRTLDVQERYFPDSLGGR